MFGPATPLAQPKRWLPHRNSGQAVGSDPLHDHAEMVTASYQRSHQAEDKTTACGGKTTSRIPTNPHKDFHLLDVS